MNGTIQTLRSLCAHSEESRLAHKGMVLLSLLAVAFGAAILFAFNPSEYAFYPFCNFHRATGLLCPGCGSLRALHQLLHGHLAAATRFNALLVITLPLWTWVGFRVAWVYVRPKALPLVVRPAWLWCGLAVMLLFGVLRNLPFARLLWLAP